MKCYYCFEELHEKEIIDFDERFDEKWCRITKLKCNNCLAYVEVWLPKDKEIFKKLEIEE